MRMIHNEKSEDNKDKWYYGSSEDILSMNGDYSSKIVLTYLFEMIDLMIGRTLFHTQL